MLVAGLITAASAQTVSVLYSFDGAAGSDPLNITLTQGRDGLLYGTTVYGGASSNGAIFKITTAGKVTLLHSFSGDTDGKNPWAGLTLGTDGNFYGTASEGGHATGGVLFKMTPAGKLTLLHNFSTHAPNGYFPQSAPILASDGNFYGTTAFGGTSAGGVLYRLTPSGVYSVLYNFDPAAGSYASYAPTQGTDGFLYVATLMGGANNCGGILKLSLAGVLNKSISLDCAGQGQNPMGSLLQASDGNFYGTTFNGGTFSGGILFKVTSNLAFTTLHNFGSPLTEGINPGGGVTQATDGNLYGQDYMGGTFGFGTVYKSPLSGAATTVENWSSGTAGQGQVAQHTNGTLFGVTYSGGTQFLGSVFTVNAGLKPFVSLVTRQGKKGSVVQILGQGLKGTNEVNFNGVAATSFTVVNETYMTAVVPPGATTGPVVVFSPSATLVSNGNFQVNP
jgi:uncharacterized repeat protein (TIGR03803 family)